MSDYIPREAALESVREKVLICESLPNTIAKRAALLTLESMNDPLESIPAADVRPVVPGKWELSDETPYIRKHYHPVACSNCHRAGMKGWNFCPNCGARMEES